MLKYVNDVLALHSSWILFRVRVKAFKVVLGSIKEEKNLNLGGKVTSSYTPSSVTGRYTILGIWVRFSLWERGRDVR